MPMPNVDTIRIAASTTRVLSTAASTSVAFAPPRPTAPLFPGGRGWGGAKIGGTVHGPKILLPRRGGVAVDIGAMVALSWTSQPATQKPTKKQEPGTGSRFLVIALSMPSGLREGV